MPNISSISRKIRFLERRRENLLSRIKSGKGTERSLAFDRNEVESLDSALDAMRYHWSVVSRMENPISALRGLTEAVEEGSRSHIAEAMVKAQDVLNDFET